MQQIFLIFSLKYAVRYLLRSKVVPHLGEFLVSYLPIIALLFLFSFFLPPKSFIYNFTSPFLILREILTLIFMCFTIPNRTLVSAIIALVVEIAVGSPVRLSATLNNQQ